jgi:zinc transport system substrate-binding protein
MTSCRLPLARVAVPLLAGTMALSSAGCAAGSPGPGAGAGSGRLATVASFYPLQLATAEIGGDHVSVLNLTKPGAEPHDLELTPRDVGAVSKARVVVYEKGLQPAVDEAVAQEAPDRALDVADAAQLDLTLTPNDSGEPHADAAGTDPHFWLDPVRYSAVAQAVADRLARLDPGHRADYAANAKAFRGRLSALDRDLRKGLAHCASTSIVTSHNAFGYLAQRYGLTQVGITGLSPEAEPEPAKLAEVARYVTAHHVSTIYAETLVSPAIADTVARETGATVARLDPIEGLTGSSAGRDYFEVMRSNLATLRAGQGCS